ncbi:hypothetical protein [Schlesneria sp. DSM 10557]|uniref:hypothetical protein n=1 Tax=Schlesneria sp. DSM 10557 TaxID=3044399 RepID=UPI0035A00A12
MTSDRNPCKVKRSDLRLFLQALRNRWPVTEQQLADMRSAAMEAALTGSDRQRETAKLLLEALAERSQ